MDNAVCAACGHEIDRAARLCPFCGADPRRGQEESPKQTHPQRGSRGILEFARQRQEIVIALAVLAAILLFAGINHYVVRGNPTDAVPLTDVSDFNVEARNEPMPMPELQFQYGGHPLAARTMIVEPGAVAPAQGQ